jgi:hypothetical protein
MDPARFALVLMDLIITPLQIVLKALLTQPIVYVIGIT